MKGYKHKPENHVPLNSRLKFIKRTLTISGGSKGLYECQCGNIIEVLMNGAKRGRPKSCGCYSIDYPSRYVHGTSSHPLYSVWDNMRRRCYDPLNIGYQNYGAIGVFICDDWLNNLQLFIDWALSNGWQKGLQIDKDIICKKMGLTPAFYSPDTCTVVTRAENLNCTRSNRFITHNGQTKTLAQWGKEFGIRGSLILHRIKKGWPIEKAITIPSTRANSGRYNKKREQLK